MFSNLFLFFFIEIKKNIFFSTPEQLLRILSFFQKELTLSAHYRARCCVSPESECEGRSKEQQ